MRCCLADNVDDLRGIQGGPQVCLEYPRRNPQNCPVQASDLEQSLTLGQDVSVTFAPNLLILVLEQCASSLAERETRFLGH